ncbi:MAG: hypothetical protein WBD87_05320 [Candidatus Acidiferrales bacterium]
MTFPLQILPPARVHADDVLVVDRITAPEGTSTELDPVLTELAETYKIRRPDIIGSLVKRGIEFVEADDVTQ